MGRNRPLHFRGKSENACVLLAERVGSDFLVPCDVTDPDSLDACFLALEERGHLDFVVHAIAHADKGELKGPYYDTSLQNYEL